ncbi:hypothetical protein [Candidatus Rickettsia colombianensi]|uniref:hypothetical protein n=1 Tax=Candidatus Rickettsia colombianensi TaxID=1090944 RepID=UPI000EF1D879|nr:hypothetical protein [Candidatus Rickettsia colombianensi]
MSNNSYLENWVETISNLNNNSSEVETSQYSTNDWMYLSFNIIGVALIFGLPIGYVAYKSRCCGIVKTIQALKRLGNDGGGGGGGGDSTSINCE